MAQSTGLRGIVYGVPRAACGLVPLRKLARQLARDGAVVDLLHVVDAGEDHGGVEFAAQDADGARDARFARGAEAVEERPADHRGIGAERERAENVLTGADAAI